MIDVVDEFHLVRAKDAQKEGEPEGEPDQDPREGEKQRFREQGKGDFPLTEPEDLEGRDVAGPLREIEQGEVIETASRIAKAFIASVMVRMLPRISLSLASISTSLWEALTKERRSRLASTSAGS